MAINNLPGQPTPQQQQPQGGPQSKPPLPPMSPNVLSRFDAPVPGQSLTDTPKNAPWEHPPQFVRINDALNWVFDRLVQPVQLRKLFLMLEKGIPVEHIVRVILFAGFSEGRWTPDLALLMSHPLTTIIAGIAGRANLKGVKLTTTDRSGFKQLMNLNTMRVSSSSPEPTPNKLPNNNGLMAPG